MVNIILEHPALDETEAADSKSSVEDDKEGSEDRTIPTPVSTTPRFDPIGTKNPKEISVATVVANPSVERLPMPRLERSDDAVHSTEGFPGHTLQHQPIEEEIMRDRVL